MWGGRGHCLFSQGLLGRGSCNDFKANSELHRSIPNGLCDTGRQGTFPRLPTCYSETILGWWEAQLPFTCLQLLFHRTYAPHIHTALVSGKECKELSFLGTGNDDFPLRCLGDIGSRVQSGCKKCIDLKQTFPHGGRLVTQGSIRTAAGIEALSWYYDFFP